jgi:DNA polymerase III delta prime subunit
MAFNTLRDAHSDDPGDGDPLADDAIDAVPLKTSERTVDALARFMLDAALTPQHRRLLNTPSRLVLIRVDDENAAVLLASYLRGPGQVSGKVACLTEQTRSGGQLVPVGRGELSRLEDGVGVVLVSQNPEGVLVPEALAAADAVITVPNPTITVVRRTIRAVTGKSVRGLEQSDIDGLVIIDLLVCIRPGLSARQCVLTLRRAARFKQQKLVDAGNVIPLDQLALTREVAEWANNTLDLMRRVSSKTLEPSALRFACLQGPPGTGKTTVAASLARSAGWEFVPTSVGEWFASSGGHLGDVIRAARKFFDELAQAKTPVVGLLDEIDALPNRATLSQEDLQWWTSLITFTLTEIDRLRKAGRPILLLAATNHFEHLDAALVRPGRLERRVSVLPPNEQERRALFASCLGERIGGEGLSSLARLSVLATPARIESWCKSAIAAAEAAGRPLMLRDLVELVAPNGRRSDRTDRAVALHEAGHAIVAWDLGVPVTEISILSIGAAGGWVQTEFDDPLITRDKVERLAAVMLGGRAADIALGEGAHAGAASDLDSVNRLLRSAMLQFGLFGPLTTGLNSDTRNWLKPGASLSVAIGDEIDKALTRAGDIVRRRRDDVFRLVEVLRIERVVTREGLAQLLEQNAPAADESCADASSSMPRGA